MYGCTKECSLEGVAGLIRFVGSVSALAYLGPRESISEAISDLKVVQISISTVLYFSPSCIVFHAVCGGINPYTLTAKFGLARIDGFSPPER